MTWSLFVDELIGFAGHEAVVQVLLAARANPEARNNYSHLVEKTQRAIWNLSGDVGFFTGIRKRWKTFNLMLGDGSEIQMNELEGWNSCHMMSPVGFLCGQWYLVSVECCWFELYMLINCYPVIYIYI